MEENRIHVQSRGELIDPLVVNFNAPAASLTDEKFEFDIDADGRLDQVAMLGEGSGYLALDKNGDGQINDGSELFGPSTNNGFQELAQFDQDGSGWIDEGDDIFAGLRLWASNGRGEMTLVGLGVAGVGAIYLGHLETPFALKDENNEELGQVKRTGVFLREDGVAGTVQEVDLVA